MRILIWPVLFLLLYLIQAGTSVFFTGWLSCDLLLLALYSYAILRGEKEGAAVGLGLGFVQDAMTVGLFGYHMLTRTAIGFCIGLTKEKVFNENRWYHVLIISICTLFVRFVLFWLEFIRSGGQWDIYDAFLWESAGILCGNALLIIPVLTLVKYVYDWIREDDISY